MEDLVFVSEPSSLLNYKVAGLLGLVVVEPRVFIVHYYPVVASFQLVIDGLEFDGILVEANPVDLVSISVVYVGQSFLVLIIPLKLLHYGFQPDVLFIPHLIFVYCC